MSNEPLGDSYIIAARLRQAREAWGFTQEEVSEALGIPRTSVHAIEAGKRNVTALELRRLARLYKQSVEWLLGEDALEVTSDNALYRATTRLTEDDRAQVLKFAQFLAAGKPRP